MERRNTVLINEPKNDLWELAKVDGLKAIQLQRIADILNEPCITKTFSKDEYKKVK